MSATTSIIMLDAKGIMRDGVMLINFALSVVVLTAITVFGYFGHADADMRAWFPFLIIMSMLTGPSAFGFMFGLLMVDEKDTGVRNALAIAPIHQWSMLLTRTLLLTAYLLIWPILTVVIMNSTWNALPMNYGQLFIVAASLALMGPVTSLAVAAYASNKVEALALFKFINFVLIVPLALAFIPGDAWYRSLFLLSPSGWGYMSFDAFVNAEDGLGILYAVGGVLFNVAILFVCVRFYQASLYKTD